jgi:CHAT domain-containing protein
MRITPGLAWVLGAIAVVLRPQVSAQPAERLAEGTTREAEIRAGQVHSYDVALNAGHYFSVSFDQRGADLKPRIVGPDGAALYDYDTSQWGWEPAAIIAPSGGIYRLEVRCDGVGNLTPRYHLHVDAIRPATADDEARVRITRTQSEAWTAYLTRNPDNVKQAQTVFEHALDGWRSLHDRLGEAHALRALRSISNERTDYAGSLEYARRELEVRHEIGDDYGEADALAWTGRELGLLGDVDGSLDALARSLAMHRAAGRIGPQADVLRMLSQFEQLGRDYGGALEHAYEAVALARRLGDENREVSVLPSIAQVHLNLGEFETGIDVYREFGDRAGPSDPGARAGSAQNIGWALVLLGDEDAGERSIRDALAVWTARGWLSEQAVCLRYLGVLYSRRGDFERARDAFEQSAAKAAQARFAAAEGYARRLLGEALLRLGRPEDAQREFSAAAAVSTGTNRSVILADQAKAALALHDIDGAREKAESAIDLIESIRGRADVSSLASGTLSASQVAYGSLVSVLMAQHAADPSGAHAAQALEISERSRARSLLELLIQGTAGSRTNAPAAALDELRTLQRGIRAKAQTLDSPQAPKDPAVVASLKRQLDELTDRYAVAEARLRRENPAAATVIAPEPVSVARIQREMLDPDTVLLEYWLGEPTSYAWVVSQDVVAAYTLASRATIEAAARAFQQSIRTRPPARKGNTGDTTLDGLLVGPVERVAAGKRLIVVAPGVLQQVPFAALQLPGGTHERLIDRFEIVHAPSASVVAAVRRLDVGRTSAPRSLAIFADPVFDPSDSRVRSRAAAAARDDRTSASLLTRAIHSMPAEDQSRGKMSRLPFTRQEADRIAALAPRESVLKVTDFDASLDNVTSSSLGDYRMIHFATHGLLNTRTPQLSGLVFSLVDRHGRARDGFLRLADVERLRLNADLVVLSGCETALGRTVDGEGIIGLTRGFVVAGARRVVASLWEVDDLATAEIMQRFYTGMLVHHLSPAAALRSAQQQMAASARWGAPYYWAGFVIQGEWR